MSDGPRHPDDGGSVAVTLGDPRGIGPEIAFRAAGTLLTEDPDTKLVFVVPRGLPHPVLGGVRYVEVDAWDGSDSGAGHCAGSSLEEAISLALGGTVGAIVTGPIHKPSLNAAGWTFPGQTELFQDRCGAARVGMLMAAERTRLGGPLRVLLATTHLALRDVPEAVTEDLLVSQTGLLVEALRTGWGLDAPRIAMCALNPHASDAGLFGDEERRVFAPAVERLRDEGIQISDPLPADTVFVQALSGAFDAVVSPYHDVGMSAFKTASFGTGVNVTLGLPFVRTSPDHGTAFDLARQPGRADPSSMLEALRLARLLARRRGLERFDTDKAGV